MLPNFNKTDIAGTLESIEDYLRSHHGVVRAILAYIIRKNITVKTYGDHLTYATHDR